MNVPSRYSLELLLALQNVAMLLRRPIPTAGMPAGDAEREKHPWWKLRKWALRIAYRVVQRYGDPKITRPDASRTFAQLFLDDFSQDYLKVGPHRLALRMFLLLFLPHATTFSWCFGRTSHSCC
jgi:hypothetical protein